jgi:predicted phosphoadenosine phosphosulfate sulfurtransferase
MDWGPSMRRKALSYVKTWEGRGYAAGIPDEVPDELSALQLAPSYKAIAIAILKNDHSMQSLGFSPKKGPAYMAIKAAEIARRKT